MFIDSKGDPTLGAEELKAITDAECSPPFGPSSYISSGLESDLANLHLQDNSDTSFFSIDTSATPQKGKGAFASRDIQRGDFILSEKPIFGACTRVPLPLWHNSIEAAVRNLSPAHLDGYFSLQNSHNKCSCFRGHAAPLLGIFRTNTFSGDDDSGIICLTASRFNHSCSPNACFGFNSNTGELQIYALDTISRGEDIFISYITSRHSYGSPRRSRQAILRAGYHFTCMCSICSLPEAESKMSDARRRRLNELWEIAGNLLNLNPTQEDQILNVAVEGIRLLQEEGHLADVVNFLEEAGPITSNWIFTVPAGC
jgi:hypothetical protein